MSGKTSYLWVKGATKGIAMKKFGTMLSLYDENILVVLQLALLPSNNALGHR